MAKGPPKTPRPRTAASSTRGRKTTSGGRKPPVARKPGSGAKNQAGRPVRSSDDGETTVKRAVRKPGSRKTGGSGKSGEKAEHVSGARGTKPSRAQKVGARGRSAEGKAAAGRRDEGVRSGDVRPARNARAAKASKRQAPTIVSQPSVRGRGAGPASRVKAAANPVSATRRQRGGSTGAGPSEPMRIARAIARAGLCSRREAERWIEEGRVRVNGKTLETPGVEVGPNDRIFVDGQPLPEAEPVRLWRYHKPRGLVTTNSDPEGRETVFEKLPDDMPRVMTVGRLDLNTEGLLLLTNDGGLSRHLELPSTGWLRRYRVRAWGDVSQSDLDKLKDGLFHEGVQYGPIEASLDNVQGHNAWMTIGLREGKNREVRNVMDALGLQVNRLIRVSYGPFQLLELKPGDVESVRRKVLAAQLGPKLAQEFQLDGLQEDQDESKGRADRGQRGQKRGGGRSGSGPRDGAPRSFRPRGGQPHKRGRT